MAHTSTAISPAAIPDAPRQVCIRSYSSEAGTLAHGYPTARKFPSAISLLVDFHHRIKPPRPRLSTSSNDYDSYSTRSARIGSNREARQAGSKQAAAATTSRITATTATTPESNGCTPYSNSRTLFAPAAPPANPTTNP